MNMNCVFIDTGKEKVLIETGIGEKWNDKQTAMYGIDRARPLSETLFERTGCAPDDINIVINTHLHFDHAGGNTINVNGEAVPQFPNARYLVSRSELEHAEKPHERDRASYLPENWRPMQESGQLELMPDHYEAVPGLIVQQVRGHSETMQTWSLTRGPETIYGFADLIPTRHHLPYAWVAGFDLYPTETLAFKKETIPRALEENWMCLFYHDIEHPLCRLTVEENKIKAVEA
jgi:glyoxylase-like metal-dependent hydrolase (beta-lactamase superfamily II)